MSKKHDLRKILKDAHAHFYHLNGVEAERLRLWDIREDSIIIDYPTGASMRKTILGYIPNLQGNGIYEIDGSISDEPLPDQMDNTLRVVVNAEGVREVNRRLYPRFNFTPPLEAMATLSGGDTSIEVAIINLSAGGLRVEVPVQLEPEKVYTFEFEVSADDEDHSLSLKGKVLYEIPLDSGYAYGVKFVGEHDEGTKKPTDEVPVGQLDRTVDLMNLVNKLIICGEQDQ